ncbi:MAG: aldo/keto reductase [Proteobacteria bacterium]|nr:aldo/keto reductase [Pseudomonadota bacterium]
MDAWRNKIALGTAQFGLDYGINNARGKISSSEVAKILDGARNGGIDLLDTAGAYGDAEKVLGSTLGTGRRDFKIVSKIPPNATTPEDVALSVQATLSDLDVNCLYGVLVHDISAFMRDGRNWKVLLRLQDVGTIEKVGVSAYYPKDLQEFISSGQVPQLVQIPYNVFDRRFDSLLPTLRELNIEVHTRSIFLQGLFFVEPDRLSSHFRSAEAKIRHLQNLAKSMDIPLSSMLLSVGLCDSRIDRVVVGVDSLANLQENLAAFDHLDCCDSLAAELRQFEEKNEDILLPFKWQKGKA